MEDRKYDPNEKDTPAEKSPPERRRDGESLFQYFLRKRETAETSSTDDTETEDSEVTGSKRRWKLFKGLFSNVVDSPSMESARPSQERRDRVLPLSWRAIESTDYTPTEVPSAEANESSSPLSVESVVPTETISTSELRLAAVAVPSVESSEGPANHDEIGAPLPVAESILATPGQAMEYQQAFARNEDIAQTPPVVERERIIERGGGMALPVVLVGAEYFARKRADRKLDRKFETKTELMKKDINRGELARDQLDSLVRQNRDQLERLKQERGVQLPSVETRPVSEARSKQEASPEVRKPNPEVNRQLQSPERREAPRAPLEQAERRESAQVEQQAEKTEVQTRSERIIERSHEIKDDHTVPSAPSVGAIMAAQTAQKQAAAAGQQLPPQAAYDPQGLPVIADSRSSEVYKQAMRAGFWAAVTIIILGLIAYLMVK